MTDTTPADPPAPKRKPAARSTAEKPATKTPAAKAPAAKAPAAKAPAAKAPAAKTAAPKPTVAPIEPVPAEVPVQIATPALAPAGWYPVAPGSPQQRWWDGTQWTEHFAGPAVATTAATAAAQPAVQTPLALRAPEGTKPNTVWFWLLAIGAPVLTILDLVPVSIYINQVISGDTADPTAIATNTFSPAYLLVLLSGWFIYAVCIVFALLDWRELKARGVPKPFHWAWSFFVLVVGFPAVYVIGRSVIVKRRTGGGLAPLWVFIALQVVTFIVSLVVIISAILALVTLLGNGLSDAGNVF